MQDFSPEAKAERLFDLPLIYRGKVRDIYAVGADRLLLFASDRLSAFDCVLPNPVPDKGRVLNLLSAFWFARTAAITPNHLISIDTREIADAAGIHTGAELLAGKAALVKRARRIDVECVVRGYLSGSGWAEYSRYGTLAGLPLRPGIPESGSLGEPIFTPSIKNDWGHDENVSVAELRSHIGDALVDQLQLTSIELYRYAHAYALERGIIIADTKFEFGLIDEQLTLIDELLTPDSSRFWDTAEYWPGGPQQSYDKQPVRDFLASLGWRGNPPPPVLPDAVVQATTARYRRAYELLTGQSIDVE